MAWSCTVTVAHKRFDTTVYDHGREDKVSYQLAGFMADVHGVSVWIPLDAVEIEHEVPR